MWFRRRAVCTTQGEAEGDVVRIPLDSGTLLIMEGPLQEHWQVSITRQHRGVSKLETVIEKEKKKILFKK